MRLTPESGKQIRTRERLVMTTHPAPDVEALLTPGEVAALFRVDPKTVTRWANSGRISAVRTLGGHRRFREVEIRAALAGVPPQRGS